MLKAGPRARLFLCDAGFFRAFVATRSFRTSWWHRKETTMPKNRIVSQEEWARAHKAHLAREKELTRFRDSVAAERRELPWLKMRRDYVFEPSAGPSDCLTCSRGEAS
jgi:hypothetical protein